jgi:magnesium-transporting ATPase (P-type)
MKSQYCGVRSAQQKESQKRRQIINDSVVRELRGPSDRKIEAKTDEVKLENGKNKTWRRLAKYFYHGLGFSLLAFVLTYESMDFNTRAQTLPMMPLLLILGFVGVALLVLMIGIVNSALTTWLWFQVETSFWSMMLQGIALLVPLWIVSIPFFLAYLAFSSIATIVAVIVFQAFADGFVCKKVAETWKKKASFQQQQEPALQNDS